MALTLNNIGNNVYEVGAFDAKTYFAELLRKVQEGCIINITKNGKNVAVLQNKQTVQNSKNLAAWNELLAIKQNIASTSKTSISIDEIKELRDYGRK